MKTILLFFLALSSALAQTSLNESRLGALTATPGYGIYSPASPGLFSSISTTAASSFSGIVNNGDYTAPGLAGRVIGFSSIPASGTIAVQLGDVNNQLTAANGQSVYLKAFHGVAAMNVSGGSFAALRVFGNASARNIAEYYNGAGALTGSVDNSGNLNLVAANGRTMGFTSGFASGQTISSQFGDANNGHFITYGQGMIWKAYHGATIQNDASGSSAALSVRGNAAQPILTLYRSTSAVGVTFDQTGGVSLAGAVSTAGSLSLTGANTQIAFTTFASSQTNTIGFGDANHTMRLIYGQPLVMSFYHGMTAQNGAASIGPVFMARNANAARNLYEGYGSAGTLNYQVTDAGSTKQAGDFIVTDTTKGFVLKSPDGTCYRITVANGGTLSTTSITCP